MASNQKSTNYVRSKSIVSKRNIHIYRILNIKFFVLGNYFFLEAGMMMTMMNTNSILNVIGDGLLVLIGNLLAYLKGTY